MPAAPLGRLARSARTAKPANLAALHEPRRTATLAALFQTLEATALDNAVELFDALATDIMLRDVGVHVLARMPGQVTVRLGELSDAWHITYKER